MKRSVKMGAAAILLTALTACGGDAAGEADAESPTPSSEARSSSAENSEPDWAFSYSGALSGTVSGGITVVLTMTTGMNSVTMTARSSDTDAQFSGSYQFARDGDPLGEKTMLTFSLELEDGTRCVQGSGRGEPVLVKVIDGTEESYRAEFSGTLACGEHGSVDVTGYLRN